MLMVLLAGSFSDSNAKEVKAQMTFDYDKNMLHTRVQTSLLRQFVGNHSTSNAIIFAQQLLNLAG